MQSKGRRPAAKKKRASSHAKSLQKYTAEERRELEHRHHAPVARATFEEVIRRLVTAPPPKK